MPAHRLSLDECRRIVGAIDELIRGGYRLTGTPSAVEELSKRLGLTPGTIRGKLAAAKRWHGIMPTAEEPEHVVEIGHVPPAKPRIIVRAASERAPEGEAIRVCCIGDTHFQPGQSPERMAWIARHVCETRPDKVVHIGDLGEFASVSTHEKPGSLQQKVRPTFKRDLEAVEEGLAIYRSEAPDSIPVHIVLGNHDERVRTFETGNAELEGALWPQFEDVLARYDWRATDYKRYLFIGGVGITHTPITLMDRPYGGKTLNPLGNELTFSLIFGHTHRFAFLNVPKIGPQRSIQILNVGSAMAHGYYPSYNPSEQGAYTWGVVDCTLMGGKIVSHSFIPMTVLEARYGD